MQLNMLCLFLLLIYEILPLAAENSHTVLMWASLPPSVFSSMQIKFEFILFKGEKIQSWHDICIAMKESMNLWLWISIELMQNCTLSLVFLNMSRGTYMIFHTIFEEIWSLQNSCDGMNWHSLNSLQMRYLKENVNLCVPVILFRVL